MKTYIGSWAAIATAALLLVGCSEQGGRTSDPVSAARPEETHATADASDIALRATSIVPGSVTAITTSTNPGTNTIDWHATLRLPDGSPVIVTIDDKTRGIVTLQGRTVPQNVEIDPGPYFVPLSVAAHVASDNTPGAITSWRFYRPGTVGEWLYEFTVRIPSGESRTITINAISKEIEMPVSAQAGTSFDTPAQL